MKASIRRPAALLLLLCLLAALPGCASSSPTVMEYAGVRLPQNTYCYWLSCYRAQFSGLDSGDQASYYEAQAIENIKKTLICVSLFDSYGLSLDSTARSQIDLALETMVENCGGTIDALNEAAAAYGTDYEGLKIAITYEQKAAALYQYLFGDGGRFTLSDEKYQSYAEATYARVEMIYIPTFTYVTDKDGDRVRDPQTNEYQTTPLVGREREIAENKIAEVRAQLTGTVSADGFHQMALTYSEDPAVKTYEKGYYFSNELDYSDYIESIPRTALSLSVGEWTEIAHKDGGSIFLYRRALEGGDWNTDDTAFACNADFFDDFTDRVHSYWYEQLVSQYLSQVTVYEAAAQIRYADLPENWELYW